MGSLIPHSSAAKILSEEESYIHVKPQSLVVTGCVLSQAYSLWAKYSQAFQPWKDENITLASSLSHPENAFVYFINHRDHKADEKTQNAREGGRAD